MVFDHFIKKQESHWACSECYSLVFNVLLTQTLSLPADQHACLSACFLPLHTEVLCKMEKSLLWEISCSCEQGHRLNVISFNMHSLQMKSVWQKGKEKKHIWFGPLQPYRIEAKPGTSQALPLRQLFTSGSEPKTALPTSVSRAGDLLCNAWDFQTAKHAGCCIIWGQRC